MTPTIRTSAPSLAARVLISACLLFCAARVADAGKRRKKKITPPPFGCVYAEPSPVKVHILRGLWHDLWGVEAALARGSDPVLYDNSWFSAGTGWGASTWYNGWGGRANGFPLNWPDILDHHLYVVIDVNGNCYSVHAPNVVRFVDGGGACLILGGRFAFTGYKGGLGGVSPIDGKKGTKLHETPKGLVLEPGPDTIGDGWADLDWDAAPRVFWHHQITPVEGAKVLLASGDTPLLVVAEQNKGRTAWCALTVMGVTPEGALPFWEWDGWNVILGDTIAWLLEKRADQPRALPENMAERLASLGGGLENVSGRVSKFIEQYGPFCRRREDALVLCKAAASLEQGDISQRAAALLAEAAVRHADEAFLEPAGDLIAGPGVHRKEAGLRILARLRAPKIIETIEKAVDGGEIVYEGAAASAFDDAGGGDDPLDLGFDDLGGDDDLDADEVFAAPKPPAAPAQKKKQMQIPVLALYDYGGPEALPLLERIGAEYAEHRPKKIYSVSPECRIYQLARMAALRCGHAPAAGEVVRCMMENAFAIARARCYTSVVDVEIIPGRKELPQTKAWKRRMEELAVDLPASVLPAVAKAVAKQEIDRVVPIALAVFTGRDLDDATKETLRTSPFPAVRALAD